jgi:LysR family transcriptional regulator, transcriptional activator of the cysJI operon
MLSDFRLEVFKKVSQLLNFSRAAQELNISQPAVSNHIAELENIFGDQLFIRKKDGVVLTAKGEIFLDYCNRILFLYKCVNRELVPQLALTLCNLRLSSCSIASGYVLPEVIEKFKAVFPHVEIVLSKMDTSESVFNILNNNIDIAVIDSPSQEVTVKPFISFTICESKRVVKKLYFAYSAQNPLIDIIDNFILTATETI